MSVLFAIWTESSELYLLRDVKSAWMPEKCLNAPESKAHFGQLMADRAVATVGRE